MSSGIYNYNSLENAGHSRKIAGNSKSSLAGQDCTLKLEPTYYTKFGVYLLRGGTASQPAFYNQQIERLRSIYNIEVSSCDISSQSPLNSTVTLIQENTTLVPEPYRVWLSEQSKARHRFADYTMFTSQWLSQRSTISASNAIASDDGQSEVST